MSADKSSGSRSRPSLPTDSRQARQIARRRLIGEFVRQHGSARIDEIAQRFGISLMTAHRDIDTLVEDGLVAKARGVISASPETGSPYPATNAGPGLDDGAPAIASSCAGLIEPGDTLLLTQSAVAAHLARHLESRVPLTVATNCLDLMQALRGLPDMTLIGLGGSYRPWSGCFDGPATLKQIGGIAADVAVVSADAISDGAAFHQSRESADLHAAVLAVARRRILVAPHALFARRAEHRSSALTGFDAVVVDAALPALQVDRMLSRKINVVVA